MRHLLLALVACVLAGAAQARQNVLIVFDEDKDFPGLALINRSLREVFTGEMKDDVELFTESLNISQFKDPGYYDALREHFRRKYDAKRPHLIIAVMEPSLDFLMRQGDALFAGVPVVFCGADPSDMQRTTLRENVTGVLVERDFAPTLDIALRLQPATREVVVVGGTSRFDRQMQALARQHLAAFENRVRITWLTALPMEDLLAKLSELPAQSVVYYLTLFTDGAGRTFSPHEALSRITSVAKAPVYVSLDQYLGLGAVGGHVYSIATHGHQAAEIGVRILRGEAPSGIPIVALGAHSNTFDWRELQRWGLDERRLPAGSVVQFRPPSVWDQYRWYIVAGVTLFLLQSALVVALLANRAERRRAETARQESEQGRRQAEAEAERQRDDLAHAQRVTTLGELTASFAHELNQPLTAIAANARAARKLLAADRSTPDVDEALDDIAVEANRAADTVLRLRALFRKQRTSRAPLDVNALIEDVLRLLATNLRSRNVIVHFMPLEPVPPVVADSIQLRQVLINLLINAEDAIALVADGKREIRIETSRPDEAHVAIAIRDSGVGIPEAELERIFEHFVSSKPQGLGLGLAISRSIVEAHGGRIWATRNADRGLTLHVELPLQAEIPAESFKAETARGFVHGA